MTLKTLLTAAAFLMFVHGLNAQVAVSYSAVPTTTTHARDIIVSKLRQPITLVLRDEPLDQALARLQEFGINPWIHSRALEDNGQDPANLNCTIDVSNVSIEHAIDLLLDQVELTWGIRQGGIYITTYSAAEANLETHIYPVHDLVAVDGQYDFDALIGVITSTVRPETWDEVGGPGAIQEFEASGALVIAQTWAVHRQVETLLQTLRTVRRDQRLGSYASATSLTYQHRRRTSFGPTPVYKQLMIGGFEEEHFDEPQRVYAVPRWTGISPPH